MSSELIRTWVAGWAVSRHTPRPIEAPWGLYVEAGRHILTIPDEPSIRAAAATVAVPHTWLKAPEGPDTIAPRLPQSWMVAHEETGYLVATELALTPPAPLDGYTTALETHEGVTHVNITGPAGELAAKGQMAL
ncbi:hypothetical protein [Streptomyces sp. NRRL F-5755]|uniref:hypothetical protein n=1 Tax=Streptomyces sp. NRRL F-5755 TaxID=1519475 RepID=UPI000A814AFC|nr:hypothetical protein [Streptomyces sp. NRRL F-5755]